MQETGGFIFIGVLLLISLIIYVLPGIVAYKRNCESRYGIYALTILLGWSGIVRIIALVWALSGKEEDES